MKRRRFLETASVVASGGLAGCTLDAASRGGGNQSGDGGVSNSPSEYPVSTGGLRFQELESAEIHEEVSVGDPSALPDGDVPHAVTLWNAARPSDEVQWTVPAVGNDPQRRKWGPAVEIGLRVRDVDRSTVVHDRTYEIPADEIVEIVLESPAQYLLELLSPGGRSLQILRVPCRYFDCNSSGTYIGVFSDGVVNSTAHSSMAYCPSSACSSEE